MVKAYVLMNCNVGFEDKIISTLKKSDGIKEVHGIQGLYDIIVQLESDSEETIQEIVTKTIRKMPNIHSTLTLTRSESGELFQAAEKLIGVMLGQNIAQAYVVIHCDTGKEYEVLRNISHISDVKEADVVFGHYDVICKIETSDNKTLEKIITKAIRTLPHIRTSMTLNVIPEQES